jgi:hypothetical protein
MAFTLQFINFIKEKAMLKKKIQSQKTKAKTNRRSTLLNSKTGQETVRTGRITSKRDIKPGIGKLKVQGEDQKIRSQNAAGGLANR